MGFFDSKWVVTFEYSNGIFSANKTGSIVVEASNEYSAKDKAKGVLKGSYKYVTILSAVPADSKERPTINPVPIKIVEKKGTSYSHNPTPKRQLTPEEKEKQRLQRIAEKVAQEQKEKERTIEQKKYQIQRARTSPKRNCILSGICSLAAFLFGWFPRWIMQAQALGCQSTLKIWLDLGYSEMDSYSQELIAKMENYANMANYLLWVPFALLGVGTAVTVSVYVLTKKYAPLKVVKLEDELKKLELN